MDDASDAPAVCGVTITLSIFSNGLSGGVGSCSNTSRPAPAISSFRSASISASSSTVPPRQQLMKYAVGFIALKKLAPSSFRVCGLRGVSIAT